MTYESRAKSPMNNGEEIRLRARKNVAACDRKIAIAIRDKNPESVMRWAAKRAEWVAKL